MGINELHLLYGLDRSTLQYGREVERWRGLTQPVTAFELRATQELGASLRSALADPNEQLMRAVTSYELRAAHGEVGRAIRGCDALRDAFSGFERHSNLLSVRDAVAGLAYRDTFSSFHEALSRATSPIDPIRNDVASVRYRDLIGVRDNLAALVRDATSSIEDLLPVKAALRSIQDRIALPAWPSLMVGSDDGVLLGSLSLLRDGDEFLDVEIIPDVEEADAATKIDVVAEVVCAFCSALMLAKTTYEWRGETSLYVGSHVVPICTTCIELAKDDPSYVARCLQHFESEDAPPPAGFQVVQGDAAGDLVPAGNLRLVGVEPSDEDEP